MPEINHRETALGGGIVAPRFAASTAPGIAQRLDDDHEELTDLSEAWSAVASANPS